MQHTESESLHWLANELTCVGCGGCKNLRSPDVYVCLVKAATERLKYFWMSAFRSPTLPGVWDMGLGLHEGPVCEIDPSDIERGNPRFHLSCLQCVLPLDRSYVLKLRG